MIISFFFLKRLFVTVPVGCVCVCVNDECRRLPPALRERKKIVYLFIYFILILLYSYV
jgi:hypothetical protein